MFFFNPLTTIGHKKNHMLIRNANKDCLLKKFSIVSQYVRETKCAQNETNGLYRT